MEGHLRHHAQRSFRADEELLQVVARVVLLVRAQTVQHLAISQDGRQAQYGAVQVAVAEQSDPSSVGGHVPSDLAASFCSQIQRCCQVVLVQFCFQFLQNTASFHYSNP